MPNAKLNIRSNSHSPEQLTERPFECHYDGQVILHDVEILKEAHRKTCRVPITLQYNNDDDDQDALLEWAVSLAKKREISLEFFHPEQSIHQITFVDPAGVSCKDFGEFIRDNPAAGRLQEITFLTTDIRTS